MDADNSPGRAPRAAPIAESLARLIGRQIAEGVYRPGDKLPSLRELAQLHRYAKNTVVVAFEMLVARGLVEPRRGSGFYVLLDGNVTPSLFHQTYIDRDDGNESQN